MHLVERACRRCLSGLVMIGCLVGLLAGWPARVTAVAASRSLSEAPWGANVKVNDDTGIGFQGEPWIAVDSSGNAYAVWHDGRDAVPDIYFSYRPAGGSWSGNVRVDDDTGANRQIRPQIALDPADNAYAVWQDERNPNWDIYFSYRPAGGSWDANVRVNDDLGAAFQGYPSIGVDSSGNAYAIWDDRRNADADIYFSYRPAGGLWGANVRVDDDVGTAHLYDPRIAVDPDGNAYAVWEDERNFKPAIYFSYRPAGGSWSANVMVNDAAGNAHQGRPSIAADPAGNAYAVWSDSRNGNGDIYFSYRPAGGSWGPDVRVNDDGGTAMQYLPSVAVDASGNAYAVWTDLRAGGGHDIYFSYRPAGGSWGANVRVNDDEGPESQLYPSIAADHSGNAYAVWQDYRSGYSDIYSSGWPEEEEPEKDEQFVPELGTLALLASGLAGLTGYAWLRTGRRRLVDPPDG